MGTVSDNVINSAKGVLKDGVSTCGFVKQAKRKKPRAACKMNIYQIRAYEHIHASCWCVCYRGIDRVEGSN